MDPSSAIPLRKLLKAVGSSLRQAVPGALWIQAEISALRDHRHLYLELSQLEGGKEVARCRANLWAADRSRVEGKFWAATGGPLQEGQQLQLLAEVNLHPLFGFSLTIRDLAPGYTVGERLLQLAELRRELREEGLWGRNQALPFPEDLRSVAVISPEGAASLGDFRNTAAPLEALGLCRFHYHRATFQGREAAASVLAALEGALTGKLPDAVVIIRGGGASGDLAWLSQIDLARAVCRSPVPVLTGIGHARDDTLLDEVAHQRFDTPSKAAAFLRQRVLASAQRVERAWQQVSYLAGGVLAGWEGSCATLRGRVYRSAERNLERWEQSTSALGQRLVGLGPEPTLRRGYALAVRRDGQVLRSAAAARSEPSFELRFADGRLRVAPLPGAEPGET